MKTKLMLLLVISFMLISGCSDIPEYKEPGKVFPSGTLSINNNYFYTQSVNANLSLDVNNADEMCFSTDGATYTPWEPYSTTKSITLPTGHGQKIVYGKFRNADGESIITDTIIQLVEKKIFAEFPSGVTEFGGGNWGHTTANVAITYDGSTIITSSTPSSKVYVYRRNLDTWDESIINSPDPGSNQFGQSIACTSDGEYLVIGALSIARIYIYKLSGGVYSPIQTIDSPPPIISNNYSVTVSLSDDGNKVLVGAWNSDGGKGKAYLYERTGINWMSYSIFEFQDMAGLGSDHYGLGVKISGDGNTIAISAAHKNSQAGSLFIYKLNGSSWIGSEYSGLSGDMLGRHIGMSHDGQRIIAGTRCWVNGNGNQGTAYLYEWNGSTYAQTLKFTASDGAPDDKFGFSVAMSSDGNSVVIGKPLAQFATVKGNAYVFRYRNSGWIEEAIVTGSDSDSREFYGNITAISGDGSVIAVSSSLDTIGVNSQQGSVFLYY
ncbi:MAG: hypothetical protein CVV49_09885 [Spirochaetae bacterium HGW-Spirochaetae-5]|nr:MAG: hypothetical protein CVV49_09885 [Spirochaetae bacterium HGW-Spirochaetae-5]